MNKLNLFLVSFILGISISTYAQINFYDSTKIREIRLYFSEPNWDYILDSLYAEGEENRLLAAVKIGGTLMDSIGVRYKGYSSASVNRTKNPFNIKLDYVKNQGYYGLEKIKLSNVIRDPSFIREVLSYEIARKYMPAPQANYANVYVNDTLWGLYTNVENVGNPFLENHFGVSEGTFIKCNPELIDPTGENSNLSNSPGTDSSQYSHLYNVRSEYGWQDLYEFIDTLNNHPEGIEAILNVDRTLWMHAFNYVLVNFDSYIGYAQNYYLYKDQSGQFNPILWDLNQSFGSFRNSDNSSFFTGFTIEQAKTIDPLSHYLVGSAFPRPLMTNLFSNHTYRRMFLAHIRTIVEENFMNQEYVNRAQTLQALIDTHVQNDTNKFYSYQDFIDNLNTTVSDLIDYPGITELMDARASYLSNYQGYQGSPTITTNTNNPTIPSIHDSVWVNSTVIGADSVLIYYRFGNYQAFQSIEMKDDGNSNDGIAGDQVFGAQIPNVLGNVQYYIYAENDSAGRFSPERAAHEYYQIDLGPSYVVINEICADNGFIQADQSGDYDDWIELYNNTSDTVNMHGYYLSDDIDYLGKWPIQDTVILPNEYLMIWADNQSQQAGLHAEFMLSSSGESLFLTDPEGHVVDQITFGQQYTTLTYGRYPNGTGLFEYLEPTFNANNVQITTGTEHKKIQGIKIYPNPVTNQVTVSVENRDEYQITIRNLQGKIIQTIQSSSKEITINVSKLTRGFYTLNIQNNDFQITQKMILN